MGSLTRSFEGLNYIQHRANSMSVSQLAITHIQMNIQSLLTCWIVNRYIIPSFVPIKQASNNKQASKVSPLGSVLIYIIYIYKILCNIIIHIYIIVQPIWVHVYTCNYLQRYSDFHIKVRHFFMHNDFIRTDKNTLSLLRSTQ